MHAGSSFTTTHWTDIRAARTASPDHRQAVLNDLATRYWQPVYHYLRARGHQDAEARDLTQDFFLEVILGRDLFGHADPEKGRFRPYLLHCLKNFLRETHRRAHAACRAPDRPPLPLEGGGDSDSVRLDLPADDHAPDTVFHARWAAAMLARVIDRLRTGCQDAGLEVHYAIFDARFIRPALDRSPPAGVDELAARFGLTARQVANRGETVRRRFRSLLLEEVRWTVTDEGEAKNELQGLLAELRA